MRYKRKVANTTLTLHTLISSDPSYSHTLVVLIENVIVDQRFADGKKLNVFTPSH